MEKFGARPESTPRTGFLTENQRALLRKALLLVMTGLAMPPEKAMAHTPTFETHLASDAKQETTLYANAIRQYQAGDKKVFRGKGLSTLRVILDQDTEEFKGEQERELKTILPTANEFFERQGQFYATMNRLAVLNAADSVDGLRDEVMNSETEKASTALKGLKGLGLFLEDTSMDPPPVAKKVGKKSKGKSENTTVQNMKIFEPAMIAHDAQMRARLKNLNDHLKSFLACSEEAQLRALRDANDIDKKEWEEISRLQRAFPSPSARERI